MNNKVVLPRSFAISISLVYFIFTAVVVTAIYFFSPLIILNWYSLFERIGAEIPSITYFVLHYYSNSYILSIVTLFFSIRFYLRNEKEGVNIKSFVFLNFSLIVNIIWLALVIYSLQIPIQQMATVR